VGPEGRFTQFYSTEVTPTIFEREIAPARTFVFYEDVQPLMEKNLIKGGSLENAIVVRGDAVLSKEPLRFEDEFVRHKILDIVGDLALAGRVLDEPRLARIVRRKRAILPMPIKGGRAYLYNHNPLVRAGYPGILGVKTGYTDAAGPCLVAAARRGGRRLVAVVLHSPDPGTQARQLLDRGFAAIR